MIILEGSAGNGIGSELGRLLDVEYHKAESKIFPDGESYIKLPEVEGDIVIVQSTYAPQDKHLMELMLMADAVKPNASSITAIVPYIAYARQNMAFRSGEVVSAKASLRFLHKSGIDSLITVEPHKYDIMSYFEGKSEIVEVSGLISDALKKVVNNPIILAPDKGGSSRAEKVAEKFGCDCKYVEKKRDYETGEISVSSSLDDLSGKDVIIVDDMISTGGTIAAAAKEARKSHAKSVFVAAAHLLMVGEAYSKIKNAGVDRLFGCNTIPYEKADMMDTSELIAGKLKNILQ